MRDRIPGDPGRVKITREDGSAEFVHVERADNPEDPGTPLNKETLLRDQTETALFGNASNRTVDDAFAGIAARLKMIANDMASLTLTVTDAAGKPIPGVYVDGVFTESGTAAKTDAAGKIVGYVSEGSIPLSVRNYYDIEDFSQTFTFAKGQSYTHAIQVATRNFLKMTSSRSGRFSENVNRVDRTLVGGGGGAGKAIGNPGSATAATGGGGGGGYCVVDENVPFTTNEVHQAIVGSGGEIASDGGTSSFLGGSAPGGKGGTSAWLESVASFRYARPGVGGNGNGKGGNGQAGDSDTRNAQGNPGQPGTADGYISFTETTKYGGSGGAGVPGKGTGGKGAGYGGDGGDVGTWTPGSGTPGADGFGGGAGSGGALVSFEEDYTVQIGQSARGGSGCIAIRMHLKSAA